MDNDMFFNYPDASTACDEPLAEVHVLAFANSSIAPAQTAHVLPRLPAHQPRGTIEHRIGEPIKSSNEGQHVMVMKRMHLSAPKPIAVRFQAFRYGGQLIQPPWQKRHVIITQVEPLALAKRLPRPLDADVLRPRQHMRGNLDPQQRGVRLLAVPLEQAAHAEITTRVIDQHE